jgi:hypothetical protein
MPTSVPRKPGSRLLGQLLLGEGVITEAQLDGALSFQRRHAPHLRLGQILIQQEILTPESLQQTLLRVGLASSQGKRRLGAILVEAGILSEAELTTALAHQRRTGLRLGDVLLQLDLVPEQAVKEALGTQTGVAFVAPEAISLDPTVIRLVSRRYAQHHRVVPLGLAAGVLTVLVADPSNDGLMRELEATTGHRVRAVTSTQAAFRRALGAAYGESPFR